MSNKIIIVLMIICVGILTSGCIGTYIANNEITIVEDGSELSYPLSAGTYRIGISSNEDINIEILNYINLENVRTFNRTITIHRDTEFIIKNPFTFNYVVEADEINSVEDGSELSYPLSAGTYQIRISSDEDINIEILNYINLENVRTFDRIITVYSDTQLIITNPFNLFGDSATVHTTIYREFPGDSATVHTTIYRE